MSDFLTPKNNETGAAERPSWLPNSGFSDKLSKSGDIAPPLRGSMGGLQSANKRKSLLWLWAVLGLLLGTVLVLALRAPAAWLAWAIDSATDGRAQIIDPQGTVWKGDGKLLLTGGRDSKDAMLLPERMHWKLSPAWGLARLQVDLDCCSATPAEITLTPHLKGANMRIDKLDWSLPADLLEGLGAPLNTLALRGRIQLKANDVKWKQAGTNGNMQGNIRMDLFNMSASMSALDSLGSYRVELHGQNEGMPTMELTTTQGPLQLQGSGAWRNGRFRFNGEAWSESGYENSLNNLLNMMGNKSGDRYLLAL